MSDADLPSLANLEPLRAELRELIATIRQRLSAVVNAELSRLYWTVGQRLANEVLGGERAQYGAQLMPKLVQRLAAEFGRGFEAKNLRRMVQFAQAFPVPENVASLMRQLSWTHFLQLLPLKAAPARWFYAQQCMAEQWSVRELRRQIDRKAFECSEIANAQQPAAPAMPAVAAPQPIEPALVFKDPYFLDFLGLSQGHEAAHKGQMELYLKWLDKHERQAGEEAPIGLILCAESSRELVELLQMHKDGITVAEYWTELPPKAELERRLHEALVEARERLARRGVLMLGSRTDD